MKPGKALKQQKAIIAGLDFEKWRPWFGLNQTEAPGILVLLPLPPFPLTQHFLSLE
jgi:hypothetical protein